MKKFSLLIFIGFLCISLNSYALNKNYIENKIENVKAAIKKKKEGYLKLRSQYIKLIRQKEKTRKDIDILKRKIEYNKRGLSALNKKIELLKQDIGSISKQLNAKKAELYKEFDQYYKYSMTSGYYKKGVWYEYMNSFIVKYMQDKIQRYISKKVYLKNRLDTLKMYVARKQSILNKIQSQQDLLKRQVYHLSILSNEALRKKRDYLNQIKRLSREQDRLKNILTKIIEAEKRKAAEEARRKRREKEKRRKSKTRRKIVNIPQKSYVSSYSLMRSFKGRLMPPVRGKVVDTFGKKYDTVFRVYTRNDGIDIKARKGSCVRAVYPGKVDYVGNLPGYGGVIILNHLNGYYTVYGGVSADVRVGEMVKMQECIGRMQTDKLHFELRRHSKAVNPLKLLDRRFLR